MEPNSILFRNHLKPGEDAAIRAITKSSGVFYPEEVDIAMELATENLKKGAEGSGYHYVVAEIGGEAVGYACYGPTPCTKHSFDFYWLAVQEPFKGTGIGEKLVALTEEKVRTVGGRKLYIETSSRDPYLPARKLYVKCGYRQEAVICDFYDESDHKLIFTKDF